MSVSNFYLISFYQYTLQFYVKHPLSLVLIPALAFLIFLQGASARAPQTYFHVFIV